MEDAVLVMAVVLVSSFAAFVIVLAKTEATIRRVNRYLDEQQRQYEADQRRYVDDERLR